MALTTEGISFPVPDGGTPATVHLGSAMFNGVRDDVLYFAHNLQLGTIATPISSAEPIWKVGLESDWYNGTYHYSEFNLDYTSADGSASRRPIYITVNRSTHSVNMVLSSDAFTVKSGDSTLTSMAVATTGTVFTTLAYGSVNIGATGGAVRTYNTITAAGEQVAVLIGNTFDPPAGQSANGLLLRYNTWGTGSKSLGTIRGVSSEGHTWAKGTSGTITNAYAGYFTAPTIGTINYALYTSGAVRMAALGACVPGDRYLVVDAAGNVHVSATGPTG